MSEYIERDEAVRKAIAACIKVVGHGITQFDAVDIADEIDSIPAADVAEVRHGYWKEADNTRRGHKFICSECNGVSYYPQPTRDKKWVKHCGYSNCPHCLAKMDGKGEGE